jgi:hypothetical protein
MMPVIPLSKLHPVTTQSRSIRRQREPSAGLVLQPVSIGLSAPFPVTAAGALLMASSPARPSNHGGGAWVWQAGEAGEQGTDLWHGERQEVGLEIDGFLSPRWPPLARRSGRPGPAWRA